MHLPGGGAFIICAVLRFGVQQKLWFAALEEGGSLVGFLLFIDSLV